MKVNEYRTHWWRCDGPCVKRPPYFGIVRRAMNRAPAPRDLWWAEHQRKCGGNFIKIKEPEKVDKKKKKGADKESTPNTSISKAKKNLTNKTNNNNSAITNWFPKTSSSSTSSSTKTIKGPENSKKPRYTTGSGGSKIRGGTSTSSTTVVTSKTNQKDNRENDIFRSSSENSSSNIYGFKMSANNKATSQTRDKPASFSGSGQCLGSTTVAIGNQTTNSREAFLKKLESNKKTTSLTNSSLSKKDSYKNNSISVNNDKPNSRPHATGKSRLFGGGTVSSSQNSSSSSVETKKRKLETNTEHCGSSTNKNIFNDVSNRNATRDVKNKIQSHNVINIPDDVEMMEVDGNLVECPACPQKVPVHLLNEHLDKCLS